MSMIFRLFPFATDLVRKYRWGRHVWEEMHRQMNLENKTVVERTFYFDCMRSARLPLKVRILWLPEGMDCREEAVFICLKSLFKT